MGWRNSLIQNFQRVTDYSTYLKRAWRLSLWRPIYTRMNSSSFINPNPIYSWRDILPAVIPDSFWTDTLLTFLFCIHVLLFNTLVPSTFFSSMSSFWSLAGRNSYNGWKVITTDKNQEEDISPTTFSEIWHKKTTWWIDFNRMTTS